MLKGKPPERFREHLCDVKFDKLKTSKNHFLVIERVLDYGRTQDINWLIENYGTEEIKKVLLTSKNLSRITGNFWADLLNLDRQKLLCLQKTDPPEEKSDRSKLLLFLNKTEWGLKWPPS